MRLGAHLSIAKGLPEAAAMATRVGPTPFSFFTRNPRGGAARTISIQEIGLWQGERQSQDIYPIIGHLPYTVNLAAKEDKIYDFARMVVRDDLLRAKEMGAELVVTHPGTHGGVGLAQGILRISRLLAGVLEEVGPLVGEQGGVSFLLETMAGHATEIGGEIEHLGAIIKNLGSPEGVGICLDSCHLFAAGWDLRTREGIDGLLEKIDQEVGLNRVKAMHLNDSVYGLGSHKDRHAGIGRGQLGEAGIRAVVTHPVLRRLPFFLETPVERYEEYAGEITLVRRLAAGS
ncbi:MAG: deoxyribonuclease IV [Firmicutes bacterium]|nr:deoxyribonuclease IV [Bacillota bacterium]